MTLKAMSMRLLRALAWVILTITGMAVIVVTARAEGYVYEGMAGGVTESFLVAGGDYELAVVAERPSDWHCFFSGSLDRVAPAYSISLGTDVTVGPDDWRPWTVTHRQTLAAGQYNLQVSPETTCRWSFHLAPQPADPILAGAYFLDRGDLVHAITLRNPFSRPFKSTGNSIRDLVLLETPYLSRQGIAEIEAADNLGGGTAFRQQGLRSGGEPHRGAIYLYMQFRPSGVQSRTRVSVRFRTGVAKTTGELTFTM